MILYVYVQWQGWLIGIALYVVTMEVFGYILNKTTPLEMMSGGDQLWFMDDDRNRFNIVAFHKYDKMTDLDDFRKKMLERACRFPRLKASVIKLFGRYMFKEMTNEEMMESMNKTMPVISGIHDEKALADFMAKELSYRLPLEYLQWKVYFVPDYRPNESLFVYKVHHSLADGIANILFFNELCDKPTMGGYPNILNRFTFLQDLMIKMVMPFYLLWLTVKLLGFMKPEKNGFKTEKAKNNLNALKDVELVPDLNLDDVKRRAAELTTPDQKFTINDIIMTVLSKTMNDYL